MAQLVSIPRLFPVAVAHLVPRHNQLVWQLPNAIGLITLALLQQVIRKVVRQDSIGTVRPA